MQRRWWAQAQRTQFILVFHLFLATGRWEMKVAGRYSGAAVWVAQLLREAQRRVKAGYP